MIQKLLSSVVLSMTLLTHVAWADMVNINEADATALQQNLKGIGKVKAEAIIAYRQEHGAFKALDDLKEVKGIGDNVFEKIKTDISLTEGLVQASDKASKKEITGKSGKSASTEETSVADKPLVKSPSDDSAKAKGVSSGASNQAVKTEKNNSK
ncbi:ComEA family DNA-binding protein [Thiolinea disciformis]|uniref:ComEA family DNA-binding protein n=1 Tax=Thiolinea disciformis TaxID=125614 RepID=UPI000A0359AE|nr:helix-hairpin-helix domain-containing protein [Thiolinea disciformis]